MRPATFEEESYAFARWLKLKLAPKIPDLPTIDNPPIVQTHNEKFYKDIVSICIFHSIFWISPHFCTHSAQALLLDEKNEEEIVQSIQMKLEKYQYEESIWESAIAGFKEDIEMERLERENKKKEMDRAREEARKNEEELVQAQLAQIAAAAASTNEESSVQAESRSSATPVGELDSIFASGLNLSASANSVWACPSCTFENSLADTSCVICETARPLVPSTANARANTPPPGILSPPSGNGHSSSFLDHSSNANHPYPMPPRPTPIPSSGNLGNHQIAQTERPSGSTGWPCPHCTFFNEGNDSDVCTICCRSRTI